MKRVDLVALRRLKEEVDEAERKHWELWHELLAFLPFCDICGIVEPECGFYPLGIHGPTSISGIICNDCGRRDDGTADTE